MFKKYIVSYIFNTIVCAFGAGLIWVAIYIPFEIAVHTFLTEIQAILIVTSIFFFIVSYITHTDQKENEVKELKKKIDSLKFDHQRTIDTMNRRAENKIQLAESRQKNAEKKEKIWKESLRERCSGFPTLITAIQEYGKLDDEELSNYLFTKKHPAKKAAEIVKEQSKRRREAEYKAKTTQALIEYYESIAPFLLDFKDDIISTDEEDAVFREYSEKERQDPATNYLAKEEYRKLSSTERNQLALDRFWQRPKSKWLIGRCYERYVGYLFEKKDYDVEYVGIFKGYEDLGRDLICSKGNTKIIVQCKNWSKFKTIYENNIFQFFGTTFQYKDSNRDKKVYGVFFTSTKVSDLARRFAKELKIKLIENHKFNRSYPCIKCNINPSTKEKIYHLPFDQQYDKTKICLPGEFYARTIKEAEEKGFRRAFRWRGNKGET